MNSTEDRILVALMLRPMRRMELADLLSQLPRVIQRSMIKLRATGMIFTQSQTKSFTTRGVPTVTYAITTKGLERAKEIIS